MRKKIVPDIDKAIEINVLRSKMTWKEIEAAYGKEAWYVWKNAGFVGRRAGRRDLTYPV